jgi:maltose O-acetyltransferase
MLAGELYDPLDPVLVTARERARDICWALNATRESETGKRRELLAELFGAGGDTVWMQPPFYCDYGTNIELGERGLTAVERLMGMLLVVVGVEMLMAGVVQYLKV